ncbi:MAG: ABC transporter permease [Thermoproteota archaeon]|nr:ABC transporter permease [Candidatus Brockarchaeota archaeon]
MLPKGFLKFIVRRSLVLLTSLIIAVYISIMLANFGGLIDEMVKADLLTTITMNIRNNPAYAGLTASEKQKIIDTLYQSALEAKGLNTPFPIRSLYYLKDSLTLDLGKALYLTSDSGSKQVRLIIMEKLPQTIMLFTTVTIINFFLNLLGGLILARRYGSKIDRIVSWLAPTSVIPGWVYGIFLILVFYTWLHILPPGGMVDYPPPKDPFLYFLSVLRHMILPMLSWIISGLFLGLYSNRTFFLIFSTEDYVEVARAKGLPPSQVDSRYVLRPTLPSIITGFSLAIIGSWSGAIITETVFDWPGLGKLLAQALSLPDPPVIVGEVVIYAWLLTLTVLILDVVYAFLDPRIKVWGG